MSNASIVQILAFVFVFTTNGFAQSDPGSVFGLVLDRTDNPLHGVSVTLKDDDRGYVRKTTVDEKGHFRFRFLRVGTYSLFFELRHFGSEAREHFDVVSNMTSNYAVTMDLQGIDERILISCQLPLIKPYECPDRLIRNGEFIAAVRRGDYIKARDLMRQGVDISHGQLALSTAAARGNEEMVRFLLDAGADVNAQAECEWTALIEAISKRNNAITGILMDAGADVNARGNGGFHKTPLGIAIENRQMDVIELLLRAGANVEARDEHGRTMLIQKAREDLEAIRILLEIGADIDARDDNGRTALISVFTTHGYGDYTENVRFLVNAGVDLDTRDKDGETALMYAIRRRKFEVARILLAAGADPEIRDNRGRSARQISSSYTFNTESIGRRTGIDRRFEIQICESETAHAMMELEGDSLACRCRKYQSRRIQSARSPSDPFHADSPMVLLQAAANGDMETVRRLLESGEQVDATDDVGRTPLMRAAGNGHTRIVKRLLEAGADVNARDSKERTALMRASVTGHKDTVRILLQAGADVQCIDGSNGWTSLMKAAAGGHAGIVRLLLEHGADPRVAGNDDKTATMIAGVMGHKGIAKRLRKAVQKSLRQ